MNSRCLALLITALLPLSTQAAVETWTGPDGLPIQAEFIRRSSDYITFQKSSGARYLLPYSKLSEADRVRIDALTGRNAPAEAPGAVAATGAAAPVTASTPAAAVEPKDDSAAPAASTKAGKVIAPLIGKLVHLKGSSLAPVPQAPLAGIRYVAFYYSAHWCPPCRAFTPQLVSAYKSIKAAHPEFEVIFVSSDQDEDSMKSYMRESLMPWPAVRFDQKDNVRTLQRPGNESGIPNLVFMTADGKELATTYTSSGTYTGPGAVLATIQKHFKK
ncbi:MAG: redoxin domain-containing protein [Opitutus sp.]|nr:redoxin domain-containing protein [Opitutus sp.]MCS6246763.1 redoxin domain-containing protein [Opitutus sp.]MCS6273275.1 redoxin domain-containing protein [Opitutus sp.]MCS6276187.1 redoxin domain-containing protein [Opitutus sp.]MCS6301281.1 redoxin domain-containing protein [Opitutus sp.]